MRVPLLAALAALAVTTPALRAQQTLLRTLPQVQRLYQDRLDRVRAGETPPAFSGTASVMPDRAVQFAVSIGLDGVPQQRGHFCGGAIVDPHWVITAAHCVTNAPTASGTVPAFEPATIQVLSGTHVLYRGGRVSKVARIVVHPEFRFTAQGVPEHDVALLQFADAFAEPPVAVATEAQTNFAIEPGGKVVITGWGTASFRADSPISTNLLFAYVDPVPRDKCNEDYGGAVTERMFCAGIGVADSCQGDSGGPALGYDDKGVTVLIGVTSWGAGCTQKKYPGVYVNLGKFREWIDATIGRKQATQ